MKDSEILKKALRIVESGDGVYVCNAIDQAYCSIGQLGEQPLVDQIKAAFVRADVDETGTVEDWLKAVVPGLSDSDLTRVVMRAYRIAWLKNWIRELEDEEDDR